MASGYTTNYGLCQWQPEDKFLREEFNQNNEKIDAALKAAEEAAVARAEEAEDNAQGWAQAASDRAQAAQSAADAAQATADRALADLEPVSFNIYNLMLQNYYDGKVTGWKKALIFDGFQDQSGIASLSSMNWDSPNHSLLLDALGQQQVAPGFGPDYSNMLRPNVSTTMKWTATGNGTLTTAELYMTGTGKLEVLDGTQLLGEKTLTQSAGKGLTSYSFSIPVEVGKTYTFRMTGLDNGVTVCVGNSNYTLGLRLSFTAKTATSGSMTAKAVSPGVTAQRAVAWVRHLNGTASLSLQVGGSWFSMTRTGTRTTVNLDGTSCTESAFALDRSLNGSLTTKLSFSTSAGKSVRVYDYCVILI